MGSYSDSTSDLDEELPVFDFLCQTSKTHTEKPGTVDLDDSDAEGAAAPSSVKSTAGAHDVMMISSDSDDDAPYVPLAQRLKQRRDNVISAPSSVTNEKDAEQRSPANLVGLQLPCQNGLPESEPQLSFQQMRAPFSGVKNADTFPAKGKPAKQTVEEIQASRDEALRRRQAREGQQRDKEVLRLEQERQKAERKALAEAAKALRPEECIKHMVVAVDPARGRWDSAGSGAGSGLQLRYRETTPSTQCQLDEEGSLHTGDAVCVPEAHVVMQMTVDDFITLIHSYIQEERHGRSDSGPTLTSWVQQLQRLHPGKTLSIVVIDMEKYFRSQKSQSQRRFREAVTNEEHGGGKAKKRRKNGAAETLPEVTRVEVEEAYSLCKSDREKTSLLSDLLIRRGEGVTSTTRRVGPELSKRLFLLMNSSDPDQMLDTAV
ncbi:hypothetical protein INR49_028369 [Caranx melampygus]|nr:hypothetical protein INR49_028369 [Caranx melampygus]